MTERSVFDEWREEIRLRKRFSLDDFTRMLSDLLHGYKVSYVKGWPVKYTSWYLQDASSGKVVAVRRTSKELAKEIFELSVVLHGGG